MNYKQLVTLLLIILSASVVTHACSIDIEPSKSKNILPGDTITLKATVNWEHRVCVLEVEDVDAEVGKNARITAQSGWEKVNKMTYVNTYTVVAKEKGDIAFRVFRECSKKGVSENSITLKAAKQE